MVLFFNSNSKFYRKIGRRWKTMAKEGESADEKWQKNAKEPKEC